MTDALQYGEIGVLRDAILRAHEMAAGRYVQTDAEMLRRIAKLLDKVIDGDDMMRGMLGRGGPRADLDILNPNAKT